MAYAKMIDGMGIRMASVASELEKLILTIVNSPHADEALAIYPNIEEYIGSIVERVRKDQSRKVPPIGYGLVIDQIGSVPSEPLSEIAEAIEEAAAIKKTAEVVITEPIEEAIEPSSNWWLWLIGAVVVVGSSILVFRSKK